MTHSARAIAVTRLADDRLIRLFHEASDKAAAHGEALPAEPEFAITYAARVSNPANQSNVGTAPNLLRYLMKHKHWSPFEMANMVVEIETTRSIAAQILRHRSFAFQEFSQRYADPNALPPTPLPLLRRQDEKNRQASHDDLSTEVVDWFSPKIHEHFAHGQALYDSLLAHGVAKECARDVLPLGTPTRLYMNGTVRSWIHYLMVRDAEGVQLEHRMVARSVKEIFRENFSSIAEALEWSGDQP